MARGGRDPSKWLPLVIFLGILAPLRFLLSYDSKFAFQDSPETFVAEDKSAKSPPRRNVVQPGLNSVLYITTHFSDVHLRYLHCCWPILVKKSPLIQKLHIIVAATNFTPVKQEELDYLEKDLFASNPSYQFLTPSNASHLSHCQPFRLDPRMNPNREVTGSYKQCLANYGVSFGWAAVKDFDWMIRLNPDVLLRQSMWLLESMQNTSLDAFLISCGERTQQIHTDFWVVRPSAVVGGNEIPFLHMSKIRSRLNHERTAFHQFGRILAANRHAWVPGIMPSRGICRARGSKAPVFHDHTSCRDEEGICHDLVGWDVRN
jgi:hypothetical protein